MLLEKLCVKPCRDGQIRHGRICDPDRFTQPTTAVVVGVWSQSNGDCEEVSEVSEGAYR